MRNDQEFRESNEWVRKKFFPDKETLFSQEILEEKVLATSEVELDSIARLIANIWNDRLK